jgi:C4-dicarboxylate-specific signal transduction histidine kinase
VAHLNLDLRTGYSPILRYGFSVGCVAVALALALTVQFFEIRDVGLPLFVLAVALVTWHAGGGPSVVAVVLSTVCFDYFFTEPRYSLYVSGNDLPYFFTFVIWAVIVGGFATVRRRIETDLREAHEHLTRSNTMLKHERDNKLMNAQAIVAAIAHEIKQPLTRITAGASAAQRFFKMVPPELDKAQAALDGVVNAGHRTSAVIDGFRSLFGKADEERQLVDMNELIPEVLETLHSELKDHRVSIRVDLTPKLPLVSGNKSQLQEVVSNLIINSIEAMETTSLEGRWLLIHTEIQGDNIAVAVEDSGPGIDKDQLNNIFTAFATTKPHGMGLGLAISRMIIDYHGGKLTAASDSKYGGASFHFVLPTADRR